ncbi:N-acetylmuramoyl-L-alanine amidase [Paracoccus sp. Z330]|uniref:N-acetylmuramoyl-L-alanine amidase n=1 Tax=Paracoccus onchidii TaxID=3017813 RepID=A0ABT4ZF55_9RHOB|nr:N-acetylmuramoyl-L-alanine amidase [Paracoccus onchidii]MDB6177951.1 N-acetylmuramoyl-L-alanine amidase [Paracoccus onchidii]
MKRIIWHWTAGTHRASAVDRDHYHLLIEGDGKVVYGARPISANAAPLSANYARHTASLNTDSIGIAVCAMDGAVQLPFDAGRYPITEEQLHQLVTETARLAKGYNIPVSRQTILSHAEVQPTLGVTQAGKWDIAWLPGRSSATDPIGCGDHLRYLVAQELAGTSRPPVKPDIPAPDAPAAKPNRHAPALIVGAGIGAIAILKLLGVI